MHGMYAWNDLGTPTLPLANHSQCIRQSNGLIPHVLLYGILPQALFPHFQHSHSTLHLLRQSLDI